MVATCSWCGCFAERDPTIMDTEQLSNDEVYGLLSSISTHNLVDIDMVTGSAVWFTFDGEGYDPDRYTFEVNIRSGYMWLHKHIDDGTETIWKNKQTGHQ